MGPRRDTVAGGYYGSASQSMRGAPPASWASAASTVKVLVQEAKSRPASLPVRCSSCWATIQTGGGSLPGVRPVRNRPASREAACSSDELEVLTE